MFAIKDLFASVGNREIVRSVSLSIPDGGIHAVMGPNGSGKSTLAKALLGHPSLACTGSIRLDGEELAGLTVDERSRKGMFLAFQNPEEVEGVKVSNLIRKARAAREGPVADMDQMVRMHETLIEDAGSLGLDDSLLLRPLNVGCSGGEKKRLEAPQMLSLSPKAIVLDELDSGLDVDGVRLISEGIRRMADGKRCFLIITHYPRILNYIKPDRVHVLVGGRIAESGGPELAQSIEEGGYSRFQGGGDSGS